MEIQMCNHKNQLMEVYVSQDGRGGTEYRFGWLSSGETMSVRHMPSNALKCSDCGELLRNRHPDFTQIEPA